jgi:hypothetical protein
MGMALLQVRNVDDDDLVAIDAEAARLSKMQHRQVTRSELVRAVLAKRAEEFRRKGKR